MSKGDVQATKDGDAAEMEGLALILGLIRGERAIVVTAAKGPDGDTDLKHGFSVTLSRP